MKKTILYAYGLILIFLASADCALTAQVTGDCGSATPIGNHQWASNAPTYLILLEEQETKWFKFPIVRERQYIRFTDVNVVPGTIFWEVYQDGNNQCPGNGIGLIPGHFGYIGDNSDNEFYIEGFDPGKVGYILFYLSDGTSADLELTIMFGDPGGDGEDDFSNGNIPFVANCGSMSNVSTLMRNPDPEVAPYLGPDVRVGMWLKFTVGSPSYLNFQTTIPEPSYQLTTTYISDVVTGAGPPEGPPIDFETGALCTWGRGTAAGEYYLFLHTREYEAPGFINICKDFNPVPQPDGNDAFDGAFPVAPSTYGNCSFTHANIANATRSPYPQDCTNYSPNTFHNGEDIWYSFTATQSDYYFIIKNIDDNEGTLNDIKMSVLTADGSQVVANSCEIFYPIGATEAVSDIRGLIPGNVYKIRLGGWSDENNLCAAINCSFDFCLAQPDCSPNDECSEAIPFTPPAPGGSITLSGTTYCAELEATGDCDISGNRSAWYSFIATESSYDFKLVSYQDVFSNGSSGVDLELTTDCNGSTVPGSCIDLLVGQTEPISGLTIGQTYYLRVNTGLTDAAFTLQIERPNVSNNCNNVSTLPVSANCNYTNISTVGATQSLEGDCGGNDNDDDVWYSFTPTTANTRFSVDNLQVVQGSFNAIYFGVYQTCGTAALDCFFLGAGDEHIVSSLTPGQPYKLQMFTSGTGNFGTFDVCLQSEAAPANDLCANAQSVSPSLYSSSSPNVLSVNTLGATGGAADCFGDPADDDLWYSFTAVGSSYFFKAQNIVVNSGQPGFPVVKIEFFESCGGMSIGCFNLYDGYGKTQLFTSGQTYFYRVWTEGTDYTATFDLLQLQLPNTPANDYCDAPVPLTVHAFNDPCVAVAGSTLGGTYSPDFDCGFDWWDDVYFSFTADYPAVAATFDNFGQLWGNSTGLRVQLFGGCLFDHDFVCHQVAEGGTVLFANLNVGQTYFIKVFSADCLECYTSFDVCLKEGGPANDVPNFNFEYNVNNGSPLPGTTANASYDASYGLPTCVAPGTPIQDVWYFLENYDHINGEVTIGNANSDIKSAIYKGDINTPANLEILPSTCGSGNRTINLTGLEQGQYYWLRVWSENGNTGSFEVSYQDLTPSTATVAQPATNTCSPTTSVTVNGSNLYAGIPVMLLDDAVLIIYPNGNDLGQITVDFYVSSTPRTDGQGIPYLKRNMAITPQFQPVPGNPVTLRFLMTVAEFNALAVSLPDFNVTRVNGQPCAGAVAGSGNTLLSQPYAWANGSFLDGYYFDVQTDHFSSFYAHGGNVPLQGAALPVELLDFQAKTQGENAALLTWRTASETSNEGFFVEKSTDGRQFGPIGFEAGSGTSQEERRYLFLDENFHASAYYRLRQVDFDGQEQLSNLVFLEKGKSMAFSLYPNPASGAVSVHVIMPQPADFLLLVNDAQGRLVERLVFENTHLLNAPLDVQGWAPGLYSVTVSTREGSLTRKVLKQ